MSNTNVIPGDFGQPVVHESTIGGDPPEQAQEVTPVEPQAPPNAFFDLTQEQILALEPLDEAGIKEALKLYPRLARNFYNLSEQYVVTLNEMSVRGRLLAGLLYQAGGKLTIDCLPMSKVRGDEGFHLGEGRFKSTVIGFKPKLVSGSSKLIQG